MILYKYTSRIGMKAILGDNSLLVRPLNEFNDPFESVPAMSDEALRFLAEGTFETKRALTWLSTHTDFVGEKLTVPQLQVHLREPAFRAKVAEMLARRTRQTKTLSQIAIGFQDHFSRHLGLVCLTKDPNNLLMWAHYAEAHRGYLFRIDTSLWEADNCRAVVYDEHRATFPGQPTAAQLATVLHTKSPAWEYEKEYRSLCTVKKWTLKDDRREDYLPLKPNQIQWICAGIRTNKEELEELRSLVPRSSSPEAHLGRARLHPDNFEIQLPPGCNTD